MISVNASCDGSESGSGSSDALYISYLLRGVQVHGNNRNITSSAKQLDNDGRRRSNSDTSASAFGSPRPPTSSHHVAAEWELCVCVMMWKKL